MELKSIFDFLQVAEKLKVEKRDNKMSNGDFESVAAHSWQMGLFSLLFNSELKNKVDIGHVLKLVLVHDLPEAVVGDMSWAFQTAKKTRENKKIKEAKAMQDMIAILPKEIGAEIMSLWNEYEEQKTPEAKYAMACDKLEAFAQGLMLGSVKYWNDYGQDFYFDDCLNNRRERFWEHEPILKDFNETMKTILADCIKKENIEYPAKKSTLASTLEKKDKEIEIAKCQSEQLDEIARVYFETYTKALPDEKWTLETAKNFVKYQFEKQGDCFFVATQDKNILGATFGYVKPFSIGNCFMLEEVFVDPKYQASGIGKKLLNHLLQYLKDSKTDIKQVMATTYENENQQPLKWYLHSGFKKTDLKIIEANLNAIQID